MAKKTALPAATDASQVKQYMETLVHPMKKEVNVLRRIIRETHTGLGERIKWNAPSYYYKSEDIVTFGPLRKGNTILLVFHHPFVVKIKSDLLQGNYKDRRLLYLDSSQSVRESKKEIQRIMAEIIRMIDSK